MAMQLSLLEAFQILGTSTQGILTNIYGPPQAKQKFNFMEYLSMIKMEVGGRPWILGRDFNLVRNLYKKKEGYGS